MRLSCRSMKRFAIAVALISISGLSLSQPMAASDASPRDQHAAQCVAALEANTQDLAQQVKSGKEASRKLLLDRLVSGVAFVGDTFLHGNVDEDQARQLADAALEAQKKLSAKDLAALLGACADEGAKLYASSNAVQRAVVKRLATRRMAKLLRP